MELNWIEKAMVLPTASLLKGIVHPKMEISWTFTHPQAIQDVDEFDSSSDLEKFNIALLAHQWMWMGAVRMRVQTADKNITSNPHHSSPSINVLRSEKLCVCKKQILH